jgi:hypothetical protein
MLSPLSFRPSGFIQGSRFSDPRQDISGLLVDVIPMAKAHNPVPDLWAGPIAVDPGDLWLTDEDNLPRVDFKKLWDAARASPPRRGARPSNRVSLTEAVRELRLDQCLIAFRQCAAMGEEKMDLPWVNLVRGSLYLFWRLTSED